MGRHSGLVATAAQCAALVVLSRSMARGEADRARAILWTLTGQDGATIGRALGVRADRVRHWRGSFRAGGVDALRSRPHTGRPGDRGASALACAQAILIRAVLIPTPRYFDLPGLWNYRGDVVLEPWRTEAARWR